MQGGASGSGSGSGVDRNADPDWRSQLHEDARQRIVNKIIVTLKSHVPEGLSELQTIAMRFEEKIYRIANSQDDYLRQISLKMLSMETRPGLNRPPLPNQEGSQGPVMTGGPQLDYEPEEEEEEEEEEDEEEDDDIYISDEEELLPHDDPHEALRLNIDGISYEELLALEERIGNVKTRICSSKLHEFVKEVIFSCNPDEAECCTICLEEHEDGEILRELHCGHKYHLACIARWIKKRPTCPVCKRRPAPCI